MALAAIVVLGFVGLNAPFFWFEYEDAVPRRNASRSDRVLLVAAIVALVVVPLAIEDAARSRLLAFRFEHQAAALLGTGFLFASYAAITRRRCSVQTGGRWIRGHLYIFEDDSLVIRVAVVRALAGAGLLLTALQPLL